MFFKVFAWIFGILCLVSAGLQYNDPDPLFWMVIYGTSALVSFGLALEKLPFYVPLIGGVLCAIGFVLAFPEQFEGFEIGSGEIKNVEEGREAFGLLIVGLVLLVFSAWERFRTRLKV